MITRDITERKRRERELLANVEAYEWLRRVRTALNEDRFMLYSQPIVETCTGEVVREELLLRMLSDRGDGDVITPGAFLPVAEEFGMIGEIDRWVIREGIALLGEQREVAINLSGRSIGDPSITKLIEAVIRDLEVDPSKLTIEITETALVQDMQAARAFTDRLERLGCALALDDFGTGYGSFTYLKHLPVQYIKIDIDFIRELPRNPADRQIVRSIVGVAKRIRHQDDRRGRRGRGDARAPARIRDRLRAGLPHRPTRAGGPEQREPEWRRRALGARRGLRGSKAQEIPAVPRAA